MTSKPITGPHLYEAREYLRQLHREKGRLTGCTSYIQRKMMIGFNHAAGIMQHLEIEFITPPDKNGERFFR